MTELTEQQLWDLERIVDDNIRYLVLREDEDIEQIYRMIFPSFAARQEATIEKHLYRSQLRAKKGLKTRWQLEKENKAELSELRDELRGYQRELEEQEKLFIDDGLAGSIPDGEVDPDGFRKAIDERTKDIVDIQAKLMGAGRFINQALSVCVEELAEQHYIARLTQLCWECKDEQWGLIWETWDDYLNDQRPLSQYLLTETRLWLQGGVPPFGNSPSQPPGGTGF